MDNQKVNTINSLLEPKGFMVTQLKNESDTEIFLEVVDFYDKKVKQARILKWNGDYKGTLQLQAPDNFIYVHYCTL